MEGTEFVYVWVVDLGPEENFGWNHWVLISEEKLTVEHSTLVGGTFGACKLDEEMSGVGFTDFSVNAWDYREGEEVIGDQIGLRGLWFPNNEVNWGNLTLRILGVTMFVINKYIRLLQS